MFCPYLSGTDLEGELVKVECQKHDCIKYIQIQGTNPQTGAPVSEFKCADEWVPILLIEGSSKHREVSASLQSFRNEIVKVGDKVAGALTGLALPHETRELPHADS